MRNEFEERGSHRFCLHELHQTLPSVRGEISLSEGEVISTEQEPESGQVKHKIYSHLVKLICIHLSNLLQKVHRSVAQEPLFFMIKVEEIGNTSR